MDWLLSWILLREMRVMSSRSSTSWESWRTCRPITAWARQLCSLPGVPWSSTYMPLSMAARGLRSSWDRMARNSFLRRSAAFRAASLSRSSPSAWRRSADSRRSRALVFSCWSLSSASVSTRATTLPNRLPSVSRISRSSLENGSDPPCPTMATAVIRRSRGSGRKASEQAGSARVWVPRKPVSSTARISPANADEVIDTFDEPQLAVLARPHDQHHLALEEAFQRLGQFRPGILPERKVTQVLRGAQHDGQSLGGCRLVHGRIQ